MPVGIQPCLRAVTLYIAGRWCSHWAQATLNHKISILCNDNSNLCQHFVMKPICYLKWLEEERLHCQKYMNRAAGLCRSVHFYSSGIQVIPTSGLGIFHTLWSAGMTINSKSCSSVCPSQLSPYSLYSVQLLTRALVKSSAIM